MYAFVLQEAEQMQTGKALHSNAATPRIHKLLPAIAFKKFAGRQTVVDAFQLLYDDAPGAHVQMSDFRRALITCRQTDSLPARIQRCPRILFFVRIDVWRVCGFDGVALDFVVEAPTVADDKCDKSHCLIVVKSD